MEIYRLLALDRDHAFEELCEIFDQDTANGCEMGKYNELLSKAMADIRSTIGKKVGQKLQSSRDGIIPIKKKDDENTFELITWLVIK